MAALASIVVLASITLGSCSSAPPSQRTITLTLIRHAESEANAAGIIDTSVPGPPLTALGQQQASTLAHQLENPHFDGVYASELMRTQSTAQPIATALDETITVLPGLNEIPAGWFDGEPVSRLQRTYLVALTDWLRSDRNFAIPGSISGTEFNNHFSGAVQHIYDSGNSAPVAFSSSAAIMVWTLMNVHNPQDTLLTEHPLPNTGRVVINGNPITGWTLISWDGITDF